MPSRPPRLLEAFFAVWIPPACREEVLGDLSEKYVSPAQYIVLAICTLPFVILSRARRVTEAPVLFMQALLIYGCYLAAGFYRDSAFLYSRYGLLRTALPLVPFLLALVYCDIYFGPAKSPARMAGRVAYAALASFLLMARFACGAESACLVRTLPDWMNLLGSAVALLLVTALRTLFRSSPDIGHAAGPAHWLKQTAAPVALSRNTFALSAVAAMIAVVAAIASSVLSVDLTPAIVPALIVFLLSAGTSRKRKD